MDQGEIRLPGRDRPRLRPQYLAGDKGYDGNQVRRELRKRGIIPIIPPRKNRKRAVAYDKERYRERNVIERRFNGLKQWRRVATRYEKHAVNYASIILIASAFHFLNLLI